MVVSGTPMVAQAPPAIDVAKAQAFMGRLLGDLSGAMTCWMCLLGDRLGLFRALATRGPSTSAELATSAALDERYTREWLAALAAAGYLGYEPDAQRYSLPPEHAAALAWDGTPMFIGGAYQQLAGLAEALEAIVRAFRTGGGVPESAYGQDLREGMDRISASWFDHLLVQQWIASLPHLQAQLVRGAQVGDIGCGGGRALINLARAFPQSRFVGFDTSAPAVARATDNARAAGVDDRVSFEQRDAVEGLPYRFDVVTLFDVLHDVRRPDHLLALVRAALLPGGSVLIGESRCAEAVEANVGPVSSILYATSVLYCLPTALANGAAGLGTLGMPESRLRRLCEAAGFVTCKRLPVEHPFMALYQVTPATHSGTNNEHTE